MAQPMMPRVRNACEACHKRKQRCILPDAGGSCLACRHNARQCYFVPRIRPGKPPRDGHDKADLAASIVNDSVGLSAMSDPTSPFSNADVAFDRIVDSTSPARPALAAMAALNTSGDDFGGIWDPGCVMIKREETAALTRPHRFTFALPESGNGLASPLLTPDEPGAASRALQGATGAVTSLTTTAAALAAQYIELDAQRNMLQSQANGPAADGSLRSKIEAALVLLA
jgi:hypothetical protein